MITGGGVAADRPRERDPSRDRDARVPGQAPAVLRGARLWSVPRELRRSPAGPELRVPGLTAPCGREVVAVVVHRQDHRRRWTLVLLVITSFVLITLDERGSGLIDSARSAAQDVVLPIQNLVDDAIQPAVDFFDGLGRGNELQSENARLRNENTKLRGELEAGKAAVAENEDLKAAARHPADRGLRRRGRVGRRPARPTTSIAPGASTREVPRASRSTWPSWSEARPRPRSSGACRRVSSNSATIQRVDDRSFSAGAQLMQTDGSGGPIGSVHGLANSRLLSFELFDISNAGVAIAKGRVRADRQRRLEVPEGARDRHGRRQRPGRHRGQHATHASIRSSTSMPSTSSRCSARRPYPDDPPPPTRARDPRRGGAADHRVHPPPHRRGGTRRGPGVRARGGLRGGPEHRRHVRLLHGPGHGPVPHHAARAQRDDVCDHRITRWGCSRPGSCGRRRGSPRSSAVSAACSAASSSSPWAPWWVRRASCRPLGSRPCSSPPCSTP